MSGKAPVIRKADSHDISMLSRLIRESFRDVAERFDITPENCPKHPSHCTEGWIEKDLERGVSYYILERNGLPRGCVGLEKAGPHLYYLERLAVLPEGRKAGFGKRLIKHALSVAKALGAREISIGIIAGDMELRNWYQKMGFVEVETKKFKHLPFLVTFMRYGL